ncbi:MAG: hydrogenase maturation protease [Burkholderiales bacterium]
MADVTIAVIGCGNPARSDDGAGCEIVRLLKRGPLAADSRVRLLDAGTDGLGVMLAARGATRLVIVDACRSGSTPGALFEVPGAELATRPVPSLNLHDFRWEHALYAGRQMYGDAFPSQVTVMLIEAASVDFGIELSPAVAAAAHKAAARIEQMLVPVCT